MNKSSEVLRLAAEFALEGYWAPKLNACDFFRYEMGIVPPGDVHGFANACGYEEAADGEETCMVLCLAAAIAESEGD